MLDRLRRQEALEFRKRFRRSCSLGLIILIWNVGLLAQTNLVAERFTVIRPGISNRKHVEKKYGMVKSTDYFVKYEMADGTVSVTYSSGGCDSRNRKWGLPKWTVEEISFDFGEKVVPLEEVLLDMSRFQKEEAHVIGYVKFINNEYGILTEYYEKYKTVQNVTLSVGTKMQKKLMCGKKR